MEIPLHKATNLIEAYRVLNPVKPLEGEGLSRFYADRPPDATIESLIEELRDLDPSEDDKTLFTGHRGCGKTTELARLEQALQDTHFVIRFDVESLLNLADVDYADLLVAMGLQVFSAAHSAGVHLNEEQLQNLLFWYRTHILEEDEKRRIESQVGGELNAGIAKISLKLSTDAPRRQTVRAEAKAHLSDLLERLNVLLEGLQKKSKKRVIVIVDGLDKIYDLRQVSDLFFQGANALLEPACRVIYTVPLSLYYTEDFQQVRMAFSRSFFLPNVKTHQRNGELHKAGRDTLLQVLYNRMEQSLLTTEASERLVTLSGGLMKELIGLARQAVLHARRQHRERERVEVDDVEYAARGVRNTYRANLDEEEFTELARILQGGSFINSAVARRLVHKLSLLQYDGGDAWWDIHPIVRPLVEEWLHGTKGKR